MQIFKSVALHVSPAFWLSQKDGLSQTIELLWLYGKMHLRLIAFESQLMVLQYILGFIDCASPHLLYIFLYQPKVWISCQKKINYRL